MFLLVLAVVLASTLLPNTGVAWMREHWLWFNLPMLWIESVGSAINVVHGVLFLLLGMAARVAMPHWRLRRWTVVLLVLGAATEVAQFLVPGRHPRLADLVVDVVAGVLGWAAMRGLVGRT